MSGFRVYIDEAGDEGFTFRTEGQGSSEWFVLSAVVTRSSQDEEVVGLIDEVRGLLNRSEKAVLHFCKLKHEHRLPLLQKIGEARVRTVSVLVHKKSLEADRFVDKGMLYRYCTRLLLERVSWLCRDTRKSTDELARLIFSNRANMSYEELSDYLQDLRSRSSELDVRIDWSTIDLNRIMVEQHGRLKGLQIADAVASGMYSSLRLDRNGFNEPRYAELLRPTVYSHKRKRFGYGAKVWPQEIVRSETPTPGTEWLTGEAWN